MNPNPKFKIGDKVRTKSRREMEEIYRENLGKSFERERFEDMVKITKDITWVITNQRRCQWFDSGKETTYYELMNLETLNLFSLPEECLEPAITKQNFNQEDDERNI